MIVEDFPGPALLRPKFRRRVGAPRRPQAQGGLSDVERLRGLPPAAAVKVLNVDRRGARNQAKAGRRASRRHRLGPNSRAERHQKTAHVELDRRFAQAEDPGSL